MYLPASGCSVCSQSHGTLRRNYHDRRDARPCSHARIHYLFRGTAIICKRNHLRFALHDSSPGSFCGSRARGDPPAAISSPAKESQSRSRDLPPAGQTEGSSGEVVGVYWALPGVSRERRKCSAPLHKFAIPSSVAPLQWRLGEAQNGGGVSVGRCHEPARSQDRSHWPTNDNDDAAKLWVWWSYIYSIHIADHSTS